MKKILLVALFAITLLACSSKNEYKIVGTADGLDGKEVVLEQQDTLGGFTKLQTTKVKNGKFEFKGKFDKKSKAELGFAFISLGELQGKAILILEGGADIKIKVRKDTLGFSEAGGSVSNIHFIKFNKAIKPIQNKIKLFKIKNEQVIKEAEIKNDTATRNKLINEFKVFQTEIENLALTSVDENPKSYFTLILIQEFLYNPSSDKAKLKKSFEKLDSSLKNCKLGKKVAKNFETKKA